MKIARRLFVVPLANGNHGKSTLVNALIAQGTGKPSSGQKGPRKCISPWGREIDAYIFIRSYHETEKDHGSVIAALDHNDPQWRERELIIFPSHLVKSEVRELIEAAHAGGFDAICASMIFTERSPENRNAFSAIWQEHWDERWTVPNPRIDPDHLNFKDLYQHQAWALGCDLWTWICRALAS